MEALAIIALFCAFLPFLVSLGGRGGIWKFLSFVFCCFSVFGAASVVGIGGGIFAWVIAWIFTAIAAQARRSEDRFAKMERNMLAANAAEEASSPVGRLLQTEKWSFVSPGQLVALVLVFGIAAALIVTVVKDTKTSNDKTPIPTSAGTQTVAAMAPQKTEPPTPSPCAQMPSFRLHGRRLCTEGF
jgi:hypothetical protein